MENIVLQASPRTIIGKQVRALRREGILPAVIYGHNIAPLAISMDFKQTSYVLAGVSSSHLIAIMVEGKEHNVLVQERQRDPVSDELVHVDFLEVSMTEKLRVTVRLVLRGDAPAVKTYNGVIVSNMEVVEVESLPGNLPEHLEVDLTSLKEIGDSLLVRDIPLPADVEMINEPDEIVVVVAAPISEAEEQLPEAELGGEEPEVIERGRKEEDFD
jgi:large subunit ribosomal protein L25